MCTATNPFGRSLLAASSALLLFPTPHAALAQPTGAELVTSALVRPLGVTTDALGRIWVAETGTGTDTDDGRISVDRGSRLTGVVFAPGHRPNLASSH